MRSSKGFWSDIRKHWQSLQRHRGSDVGREDLVDRLSKAIKGCLRCYERGLPQAHWADAFWYKDRIVEVDCIHCGDYPFDSMLNEIKISIKSHGINEGGNKMGDKEDIREEIKTKLLQTIKDVTTDDEIFEAIQRFNEFLNALSVEEGMKRDGGKA